MKMKPFAAVSLAVVLIVTRLALWDKSPVFFNMAVSASVVYAGISIIISRRPPS